MCGEIAIDPGMVCQRLSGSDAADDPPQPCSTSASRCRLVNLQAPRKMRVVLIRPLIRTGHPVLSQRCRSVATCGPYETMKNVHPSLYIYPDLIHLDRVDLAA